LLPVEQSGDRPLNKNTSQRAAYAAAMTGALVSFAMTAPSASAKQVCGWYAIISCSSARAEAVEVVNKGWGTILDTDDYNGLAPGLFCVASGPQPKASAVRDLASANEQGLSDSAYIKRACTDAKNVGD
jgi:hypothetical protein